MSANHNGSNLPGQHGLDRGETTDVVELHAMILRERPEPVEGSEPLSLWLVVFIAALLFWAGSYLTHYSGGFRSDEFNEVQINPTPPPVVGGGNEDPATKAAKEGAIVFNANCVLCHQVDGNGLPNQFPPLAGSDWVQAEGPNRIARIVLNGAQGPIKVKGLDFNGAMTPFLENLDDKQVAAVLTYIRTSWGNKASMVKPEEVAAIRKQVATTTPPWNPADLEKIPVSSGAAAGATTAALTPDQLKDALKKLPADQLKAMLQELGK